jgi:hypothetical protein
MLLYFVPILDSSLLLITIRTAIPDASPILVSHRATQSTLGSIPGHVTGEHTLSVGQVRTIGVCSIGHIGIEPAYSVDLKRAKSLSSITTYRPKTTASLHLVNSIYKILRVY